MQVTAFKKAVTVVLTRDFVLVLISSTSKLSLLPSPSPLQQVIYLPTCFCSVSCFSTGQLMGCASAGFSIVPHIGSAVHDQIWRPHLNSSDSEKLPIVTTPGSCFRGNISCGDMLVVIFLGMVQEALLALLAAVCMQSYAPHTAAVALYVWSGV